MYVVGGPRRSRVSPTGIESPAIRAALIHLKPHPTGQCSSAECTAMRPKRARGAGLFPATLVEKGQLMNGYQITFFTQQDHRHNGKPVGDWLVHLAQELGLRGAT